jgi:hypothetical protein
MQLPAILIPSRRRELASARRRRTAGVSVALTAAAVVTLAQWIPTIAAHNGRRTAGASEALCVAANPALGVDVVHTVESCIHCPGP